MGLQLDQNDKALLRDVEKAIAETAVLTNDYYSWPRESKFYREGKMKRMRNAVAVIMEEQGLGEACAKSILKDCIVGAERNLSGKVKRLVENTSLSRDSQTYLEAMKLVGGGHAYFCATAPRYRV